jgi:DNA-binding transcriptional ArsR family regulator
MTAPKHERLSPAMLLRVAEQFKALGEPSRLRLMNLLFEGEASVGELAERSGLSMANVSKQLQQLYQLGWVERRKDGISVVYALSDERAFALCDLMCARVRDLATAEAALTGSPPVRRKRAE